MIFSSFFSFPNILSCKKDFSVWPSAATDTASKQCQGPRNEIQQIQSKNVNLLIISKRDGGFDLVFVQNHRAEAQLSEKDEINKKYIFLSLLFISLSGDYHRGGSSLCRRSKTTSYQRWILPNSCYTCTYVGTCSLCELRFSFKC